MSRGWQGHYENRKWWTVGRVRLLTDSGYSRPLHFNPACLDTASPYIVLPGRCPSPSQDDDMLPDFVDVEVAEGVPGKLVHLSLPPRGTTLTRFGGIGGSMRIRYLFCAEVSIKGLELDDLVNVVFLDPEELPHLIVGLADFIENGQNITFGVQGFKTK